MNPVNLYPGFCLNGKYYSVADILNFDVNTNDLNENQVQAIHFAAELFGDAEEITVLTSGSTGIPKNIKFANNSVITSAQATNDFFNLDKNAHAVLALPMKYIAGKMMVARSIVGRYNLVVLGPVSNPDLQDLKADFMPVTPFQMHRLIDTQPENLRNMGVFLIGGGEPDNSLISKINAHNISACASFGMTETLSHFALARLTDLVDRPEYIALKGVELNVNKGNLLVNWRGLTKGWLNTNDLVELTKNGFRWLGRNDNLINSGGVKIIPERVEHILHYLIPCSFFVGAIPHKSLGQELVLFAEAEITLDLNAVNWDFKHQQPRKIVVVNPFSRT